MSNLLHTLNTHLTSQRQGPTFSVGADRINVHKRVLCIRLFVCQPEVHI